MSSRKLFTNKSGAVLDVTLHIRASEDPSDVAGKVAFQLLPGQAMWQEYGDGIDIYLNGIELNTTSVGFEIGEQMIVVVRGSRLDNMLNMQNAVDIDWSGTGFTINTHEVR